MDAKHRHHSFFRATLLAGLLTASLASAPATADTARVLYRFTPTTQIAAANVQFRYPVQHIPLDIELVDGRVETAKGTLGTRTTDGDLRLELVSSNELWRPAHAGLERTTDSWGVQRSEGADLRLTVTLTQLGADEHNQAVGATYKSRATFTGSLTTQEGEEIWTGVATGATSRYGRAYSAENCSEVISDALLEGYAKLLSNAGLQAAWSGNPLPKASPTQPAATGTTAAASISPADLLAELVKLEEGGFADETLIGYVGTKALSTPLQATDLLAWKEAGLSEAVVQAAVALPVH